MSKRNKPRLGKGLTGLIGGPVPVDAGSDPNASEPNKDRPDVVHADLKNPDAGRVSAQAASDTVAPHKPVEVSAQAGIRSSASPGTTSATAGGSVALSDGRRMMSIAIDAIEPNTNQPRKTFEDSALETLAESIRASGVMQPIAVRPAQDGSAKAWELIAGERRWRAAKRAGLARIPAVIADLSERESAEWALVENLQREDLDPMERADALAGLAQRFGHTHQEIAERVGLDRSSVSNLIRMTELEPEIRMLLTKRTGDRLSTGHAKALLAVQAGEDRVALARRAAEEGWSVRALERAVAERARGAGEVKSGGASAIGSDRAGERTKDPALADIERQLADRLSSKVRIEANADRSKGRLVVEFYGIDHFDRVLEELGVRLDS